MRVHLPFLCLVVVAGCSGNQSALDPRGAPAIHVEHLIIGFVILCAVVWALVMLMLTAALMRRRGRAETEVANSERGLTTAVSAAVAATTVIVAALTIASYYTTRSLGSRDDAPVTITVTGEQWWWRITYSDADASFQTANEIHIPVGQDVRLRLESADVIHSFWVPSLAGKQDLVPGRSNSLLLRAEKAGIYRGQCAEFCGLQHSHMAVIIVAEAPAEFERWVGLQQRDATIPADPDTAAGQLAFLARPCAACHTIRGTSAKGTTGPDLTHVGSRQTIGAGLLDTTRGSLAAWVADPQTLKPGNNMPMVALTSVELRNISAYMESLK